MPVIDFDPDDGNIPPVLRERIESWQECPPSTQFQQYGPIDRYLNLKFNHDDHMVKPQALLRKPVPAPDAELLADYGVDLDGLLPEDPDDANTVGDLRMDIYKGDVSIDSTHLGLVDKRVEEGHKVYPDFLVCTFVGNPRLSESGDSAKDRILIVVEIASLPRPTARPESFEKALIEEKRAVLEQLGGYMDRLGDDGDRWDSNVVGIALLGTEVSFLLPHDGSDDDDSDDDDSDDDDSVWKSYTIENQAWFSLYGEEFLDFVNNARER
ncbi:hypothetical protein V8D89_002858 [Ganoderma adspersum]